MSAAPPPPSSTAFYSWGFNCYGQCGVPSSLSSSVESSEVERGGGGREEGEKALRWVAVPTRVEVEGERKGEGGEGEATEATEATPVPPWATGRGGASAAHASVAGTISADTSAAAGDIKASDEIKASDIWQLWSSHSHSGAVVDSTYMVYSSASSSSHSLLLQVSAGAFHTLTLDEGGGVYSCGWNEHDQLGNEGSEETAGGERVGFSSSLRPVKFPEEAESGEPSSPSSPSSLTFSSVAAGTYHSLVSSSAGFVYSFGDNHANQLGYDEAHVISSFSSTASDRRHSLFRNKSYKNTFTNPIPIRIPSLRNVTSVAAGSDFSAAVTASGKVHLWGGNEHGQLGSPPCVSLPLSSPLRSGLAFEEAACGEHHTLLRTREGEVYSCGLASHGRLGYALPSSSSSSSSQSSQSSHSLGRITEFDRLGRNIEKIRAGGPCSAAISDNMSCYTFGYNGSGALGLGTLAPSPVPRKIKIHKVLDIAFGEEHGGERGREKGRCG